MILPAWKMDQFYSSKSTRTRLGTVSCHFPRHLEQPLLILTCHTRDLGHEICGCFAGLLHETQDQMNFLALLSQTLIRWFAEAQHITAPVLQAKSWEIPHHFLTCVAKMWTLLSLGRGQTSLSVFMTPPGFGLTDNYTAVMGASVLPSVSSVCAFRNGISSSGVWHGLF